MYTFEKRLQRADTVRRYTIQTTPAGWEVREEEVVDDQGGALVHQARYHDWERVERVQRSIGRQLDSLRREGWKEVD